MPLPHPRDKEKKSEFVSRCMSEISSDKTFKTPQQKVAVCYSQFEQAKASAEASVDLGNDEMLVLAVQKFGGKKRSDLKDTDFLFPDKRSFPIMTPQDVRDAISNFGRMGGDMSYDEFINKLYHKAKSKGSDFVNMIPPDTRKEYKLFS